MVHGEAYLQEPHTLGAISGSAAASHAATAPYAEGPLAGKGQGTDVAHWTPDMGHGEALKREGGDW